MLSLMYFVVSRMQGVASKSRLRDEARWFAQHYHLIARHKRTPED
jgi:hypothetical protein